MQVTFTTAVTQEEGMNATGLPIPADAIAPWIAANVPKSASMATPTAKAEETRQRRIVKIVTTLSES